MTAERESDKKSALGPLGLGGAGIAAGIAVHRRGDRAVGKLVSNLAENAISGSGDLTDEEFEKLKKIMGRENIRHEQLKSFNAYSNCDDAVKPLEREADFLIGNKNNYAIAHELGHATGPAKMTGMERGAEKALKRLYYNLYAKSLKWGSDGIPGAAAFARQAHKEETGEDNPALRAADYAGRGLSGVSLFEEGQASLRGALGVGKVQGLKGGLKAGMKFVPAFATYSVSPVANHILAPLSAKGLWAMKRRAERRNAESENGEN